MSDYPDKVETWHGVYIKIPGTKDRYRCGAGIYQRCGDGFARLNGRTDAECNEFYRTAGSTPVTFPSRSQKPLRGRRGRE